MPHVQYYCYRQRALTVDIDGREPTISVDNVESRNTLANISAAARGLNNHTKLCYVLYHHRIRSYIYLLRTVSFQQQQKRRTVIELVDGQGSLPHNTMWDPL